MKNIIRCTFEILRTLYIPSFRTHLRKRVQPRWFFRFSSPFCSPVWAALSAMVIKLPAAGFILPGSRDVAVQAMATAGHATALGMLGTYHPEHLNGRRWCQEMEWKGTQSDSSIVFRMIRMGKGELTWINSWSWRWLAVNGRNIMELTMTGSDPNDQFEGFAECFGISLLVFSVLKMD